MSELLAPTSKERRPDRAALVIAVALFALAVLVAWDASRLGAGGAYARIGPQTIPYVIAICLAGLAGWTVLAAYRGDFPEREQQDKAPVLWIVGGLVAQMVLIKFVGFAIATGILFGLTARGFGARKLWLSILAGIVLAAVVWMIFARGLSLTLPAGPLERALADGLASVIGLFRSPA